MLVPNFILYRLLPHPLCTSGNWIGTQEPLWVGAFLGGAFGTFLLRQFFLAIPRELADAARVDGANPWQIYRHIYVPLAKPALATLAIFTFMWTWNDLIDPIIYLRDIDTLTVTAGPVAVPGPVRRAVAAADGGRARQRHPDDHPVRRRPAPLRPRDRADGDQGMSPVGASGLPLYRRIEARPARPDPRAVPCAPGAQVAPEPELMAEYGVSRATVRQALAGLVAEGLLEIRRGLGTYVTAPRFEHTIGGFYSFSREIERHGLQPGTTVLGLAHGARPPTTVAEALGIGRRGRGLRAAAAPPGRSRIHSSSRRAICRRRGSRASRPSTSRRSGCTTR